jgi:hypothetical protein
VALRRSDPPAKESYQLSIRFIISELIPNRNRPDSLIRQGRGRRTMLLINVSEEIDTLLLSYSPNIFLKDLLKWNFIRYIWHRDLTYGLSKCCSDMLKQHFFSRLKERTQADAILFHRFSLNYVNRHRALLRYRIIKAIRSASRG